MYLINTSFHVDKALYDEAVEAVMSRYVPMLEASGIFTEPLSVGIMTEIDPSTRSFAVQAKTESIDRAARWLETDGAAFFDSLTRRYNRKLVFFTTPMEIL